MKSEYFKGIKKIEFEGKQSKNPLTFHYYDPDQMVGGKPMKQHLKFAMAWWHSLCATGNDPFGSGTIVFPWDKIDDPVEKARARMDAGFEFMTKTGINFYCFHDFDLVEEADTIKESEKRLQQLVDLHEVRFLQDAGRLLQAERVQQVVIARTRVVTSNAQQFALRV